MFCRLSVGSALYGDSEIVWPLLMQVFVFGGYTYDFVNLQWVQSTYVYYLE